MSSKDLIKITTILLHRIAYLLTPLGMAGNTFWPYLCTEHSLIYHFVKPSLAEEALGELLKAGVEPLVIHGTAARASILLNETI